MTQPQGTQLRLPQDEFDCRPIPDWSMRVPGAKPRWAATYEGNWAEGGKRLVGLLVPRSCAHNLNASSHLTYTYDGELIERHVAVSAYGEVRGDWYTAHANELSREQWTAIRAFYKNLPPPHSGAC